MKNLSEKLEYSFIAFNGSKNCDHSSPKNFYYSYMKRKKELILGRLHAVKTGNENVNREKLENDINYIKEAHENQEASLYLIAYIINKTVKPGDIILEEAEKLIADIN